MKYWSKLILSLILCAIVISGPFVSAASSVDVDTPCDLTIQFLDGDTAISGALFRLYRVADVNESMEFTPVAPFGSAPKDARSLKEAALELHTQAANAPVAHTLTTDEAGTGVFSGLQCGAWLLVGEPTVAGEITYYVDPQVVILPHEDRDGSWNHNLTLRLKSTRLPTEMETVERTVVKVWNDKGYESQRPKSIRVSLLRDGKVIDQVELSAANNWRYTWKELLPNAKWTVQEDVPEKYTAQLQESEGVFTLTNTRKTIDQTGHIWWPVALLVGVGLLLIIAGLILRRSGGHEA